MDRLSLTGDKIQWEYQKRTMSKNRKQRRSNMQATYYPASKPINNR